MNGRAIFRNALQGKNKENIPFVPFVYGLAARTANMPLGDMVWDADCYTNALGGFNGLLGNNVILNNFDITVERESFGSDVEWPGEFDSPILANASDLPVIGPDDFMESGRIPVVMEVTRRLALSLGRDTAITCALTGPCSLITQILSHGTSERSVDEAIKHLGGYFTKLVRGLCELKVDALFFREDPLGASLLEVMRENESAYKALYGTLFNIVNAYNAFPVLVTEHLSLDAIKDVHSVARPTGIVLLGSTIGESELLFLKDIAETHKISFGLPLPVGTVTQEKLWNQLSHIKEFVSKHNSQNLFFTSDGEIPHDIEMELLHTMMGRMRGDPEEYSEG